MGLSVPKQFVVMVNFTIEELRTIMDRKHNIRNMSVIAHVDHGKSTLTDSLVAAAGIIAMAQAGDARLTDTRQDEQDRCITIKSTGISLYYEMDEAFPIPPEANGREFLINCIDSPGHVDFSSEVTAALRVTDGGLVVVDCVEGVCVQTETVLRQALAERIRPVMTINKLDRAFLELQLDHEEMYQNFVKSVENANAIISIYHDEALGEVQVYPDQGTVSFSAGLHGWAFTLTTFAQLYSKKFGVAEEKMMSKLWGDNFFDPKTKKWTKKDTGSGTCQRAFVQFIYNPIKAIIDGCMAGKKEDVFKKMTSLGILDLLKSEDRELDGKPLMKRVMQTWLPADRALLEMMIYHLPSPATAQAYRVETLYEGPPDDVYGTAIANCDPNGPLMLYVSKMIPSSDKGRFFAFGRVFAGKVGTGQKVRIMGPNYVPGQKKDLYIKAVQRTVLCMGRRQDAVEDVPCGNTVAMVGLDQFITKNATLTNEKNADAHPIKAMKFSVSPVVRVAVECSNASDLPKLIEGLKRLAKSDPLVQCFTAPTGEHIIAGAGELHLEICLKDLKEDFMKGAPVKMSEPVVSFCETVTEENEKDVIGKSPNKHNRAYMTSQPLGDEFCAAMDNNDIDVNGEMKVRARYMADNLGWDVTEARQIWSFGCPPDALANVLVNCTKGVSYLLEVKDSFVGAFIQATAEGILCGEAMRGIRFNVNDVTLHADAIHRGAGQIMPPVKRAMYGCQIDAGPAILEPMYQCSITVPSNAVAGVFTTLNARRGTVENKEDRAGTPLCVITAFLPVLESFGFTQVLRQNTSGQAFPQLIFSHWQMTNGSPYDENSQAAGICNKVRSRKGLKAEMPAFSDYYDKV